MLIGLCGYAKVGKDAIASALGWPRRAFADALKDDLRPVLTRLGLDLANTDDKAKARALLVEYGRLGRLADPECWVKRIALPPGDCIVADVRYCNEVHFILSNGGKVVRIERSGVIPANEEELKSIAEIDAEYDLPFVDNNGTPYDAAVKVLDAVQ